MALFRINRESNFIDGVNYQHRYGFDFGEHRSIPALGLHHEAGLQEVRKDFALLAGNGVHAVRMNVFTDGRSGIAYDSSGNPLGLQDAVVEGVLNVLRAAEHNNIVVSLVMLDHKFAERAEWIDRQKPEFGTKQGHARLLLTEAGRRELMNRVFIPLLQQLGQAKAPSLLSFELVNEPESLVGRLSTDTAMQMLLPSADMDKFKAYMRAFRDLARKETGAQFTIGSLALKYAGIWLDVLDSDLDYLSIHYYGQNDEPPYQALYEDNVEEYPLKTVKGLQRMIPVVWGEYAANGSSEVLNAELPQTFSTSFQFLEDALNNQVKGAFAWALRSGIGEWGDLFGPVPLDQHRMFTAKHAPRIAFTGGVPPVSVIQAPRGLLPEKYADCGADTPPGNAPLTPDTWHLTPT